MKKRLLSGFLAISLIVSSVLLTDTIYANEDNNEIELIDIIQNAPDENADTAFGYISSDADKHAAVIDDSKINVPDSYVPDELEDIVTNQSLTKNTQSSYKNTNLPGLRSQSPYGTCFFKI